MALVLIAEDEPTVLLLAESIIAEMGHATLSAANATQALALLEDDANRVDLLFTDIRMGDVDLDGWQLARKAVERRPETLVLYTTAQTMTDGLRALFVEGAGFLPKPYDAAQLKDAVAALLPG